MSRIAIIGTGRMGSNLGKGWIRAGHDIVFGSPHPEERGTMLQRVPGARLTSHADALEGAEVVVLAIPFSTVKPLAQVHALALRDRLVIDITNPSSWMLDRLEAGAETTERAIGSRARVVAAFKTNYWRTLGEPVDPTNGLTRDVLIAGDDKRDKGIVAQLASDLGFRPIDCGVLHNGRILDGMVRLMIELDHRYAGGEARASWKLLP